MKYRVNTNGAWYRRMAVAMTVMCFSILASLAQDISVTVSPVQQVLPPQVAMYIDNPGKYFNISLTNNTNQAQNVYLCLKLEQTVPNSGLQIITPAKRLPKKPFTVPAGSSYQLTLVDMRTMFNHLPKNEVQTTPGLFDNYTNGSFGLLPEGQYRVNLVAYKWDPKLANPVPLSNPNGGICTFTVCYKAQAPEFLTPIATGLELAAIAKLDVQNAQFTWKAPVVACNPAAARFTYNFKVVEVGPNQQPDNAMDRNPVVYQVKGLTSPMVIIPPNVISTNFKATSTYSAQVEAVSANTSALLLDYVMVENKGKSPYRLFQLTSKADKKEENKQEEKKEDKKEDKKDEGQQQKKEEEKEYTADITAGGKGSGEIDSLYVLENCNIMEPSFVDDEVRKRFTLEDMPIEWTAPKYIGGEGEDRDKLKYEYTVELFAGSDYNPEAILKSKPVVKITTKELHDTIRWEQIKDYAESSSYLMLRVTPKCTNETSVRYEGDKNIVDFAMNERLTRKLFQCSATTVIESTTPTKKSINELKKTTIGVGEYNLTIKEIQKVPGKDCYKGKGHIEWRPLGIKTMVAVKFDALYINEDDIAYDGLCVTYPDESQKNQSNSDVVDKLFSDWGIDNLIGDTSIPYSDKIQKKSTDGIKNIAEKLDISKYYSYVKKGQSIWNTFLKGEISDLHLPLQLPKSINKTPVDIQISTMKFAPTYATMDIIGEFTLPNSNYTKNDILVFGAPRLCISPNTVLPEAGTIALLGDFNITDPKSGFEMNFKAPKNVLEPVDGCYIAWKAGKLEMLGVDFDMLIPKLVKEVNGVATKEKPVLNVRVSIASWDDWMVDNVTIDPFQVESLPGWTFTATDIVYDHSLTRNSNKLGKFPSKYDKKKSECNSDINAWQGLYIKKIGVKFPKSLEFGTKGNDRLELAATDMFIDKSGATLDLGADKVLSAQTGKVGGWSFSLDKIGLSFVQNDFNDCHFSGTFGVPLLKGKIGYSCQIQKLTSNTKNAGQFAYVFKTQQVDNLSLDFFLAEAKFKKEQTYFLLESLPTATGMDTKVELLMGGDLTIGGTDYLNKKIKNSSLPIKFEIPGVHFCGMRLANCPNSWTSKYESSMQQTAKNAKLSGKQLYQGKEFVLANNKIYFHTGKWSLASPEKKLGPFEFALDKYSFNYNNNKLKASIEGSIKLISGIELSASAGLTIYADVKLPSDLSKLSDISISYDKTEFEKAAFDTKFAGMQISGSLTVERNNSDREGYAGSLKFTMPGDLFYIDANGGYFKKKNGNKQFTYGWFYASMGGKAGIPIDPAKIHRISAGFYYNCKKNGSSADPEEGIIGVVAGLGLSTTAGESMLSADLDMTVIYDSKNRRLSTFLFQGKLQAVDGLVSADVNVLYQHDNRDQFFKLDVTVDASADCEKLTQKVSNSSTMKSLGDLKQKLNSSYKKLTKRTAMDGLAGKTDDKQSSNVPSSKSGKNGSNLSASAGAKVSLQFMITMKKNGSKLDKAKWHVYLGEPEISKRCVFTFLQVKSSILSVNIGANGYVCVGNELPNNGKLPDIPYEIRKFLDGNNRSGVESADVSKANRARELSLKEFNDQIATIGGGVMFGAQVYGYLDVDLGIFYLNAGATAGFDISIIKLPSNTYCTNIKGQPGWKGWYGYGQLYAYLYAKFGLRINLGFWKKDFDVADCGIGGVFRMQGPKPSHFDGEARVKMKLLGGLVDINRKYQFSCGDECDLFMGNALDNFKLFGDLTIGYDSKDKGWADKNKIDPDLLSRPCFYTEAPLKEPFRVLDETEKARLKKNYDGDASDLDMEASRTFIFRSNVESKVTLKEYTSKYSGRYNTRTFYLKGQSRYANYIDITSLNPNCYYEMTVTGYAKEIQRGVEVDPMNWDEKKKMYVSKAWNQSKTYYFCTGPRKAIEDVPDLQEYIAIAYPSYYNKIKQPSGTTTYWYSHENDVRYPTFALTTNLKGKAFTKGTLRWKLYSNSGQVLCTRNNKWVTTSNTCNMQPESGFAGFTTDGRTGYKIKLEYETSQRVNNKYVTNTEVIADIWVIPTKSNWKEGKDGSSLQYERPFVGCRINSVSWNDKRNSIADYHVSRDPRYMLFDPYLYIGYLSNYAFVGGWEFDADRIDMNVTTAQSVVYTDKGGVYEGKLGSASNASNTFKDYEKIKSLSIYDRPQWSKLAKYPLPVLDGQYSYALTGLERAAVYRPSSKRYVQVQGYISDMYSIYQAAQRFSDQIYSYCKQIDKIDGDNYTFTNEANGMEKWYQARRGQYCSASFNSVKLQVPCYQFPIIWGSMLANVASKKKLTLWGTLKNYASQCKKFDYARGHESNSEWVFCGLLGTENVRGDSMDKRNRHSRDAFVNNTTMQKRMKNANFSIYRVNAYDFNDCNYTINTYANGGYEESFDISNPLTYYNQK